MADFENVAAVLTAAFIQHGKVTSAQEATDLYFELLETLTGALERENEIKRATRGSQSESDKASRRTERDKLRR